MQRLNDMPTSELIKTAHAYSGSIKEVGIYSELMKELTNRLDFATSATSQALAERYDLCREVTAYEATVTNLEAENAALKSGVYAAGFFSYGSEHGFEWHKSAKEAIDSAEGAIDDYRGDACDGWDEETSSVCWGIIMQTSTKVDERPRTEDDSCDPAIETVCDYALLPHIETPATDAALAEIRAQGVDMAIEHLTKKFEGTGGVGVPVMALEYLASELRKEQGK